MYNIQIIDKSYSYSSAPIYKPRVFPRFIMTYEYRGAKYPKPKLWEVCKLWVCELWGYVCKLAVWFQGRSPVWLLVLNYIELIWLHRGNIRHPQMSFPQYIQTGHARTMVVVIPPVNKSPSSNKHWIASWVM